MRLDELAFFNQQLAAMLRDGLPLEGSLRQLAAGMKDAHLRGEIEKLEKDLAGGARLAEALRRRDLPPLYKRLTEAGARGNDLPGVLQLLADHYQRKNLLWTRFKGVMVYPFLVLAVSLLLSLVLSVILSRFLRGGFDSFFSQGVSGLAMLMWIPPVVFTVLLLGLALAVTLPGARGFLQWRVSGFREASLAQLASTMALILKSGTPLPEALSLAEEVENGSPAARALGRWREQIAQGTAGNAWLTSDNPPFPPLFRWILGQARENLTAGFTQAADLYHSRAVQRADMLLYAALPISTILLSQVIFWQVAPIFAALRRVLNAVGE